ncbi:MAG: alpha/beta hydrolase [Alphaproteobacteria bacterium]
MLILAAILLVGSWITTCLYFFLIQTRLVYRTNPDRPVMRRSAVYSGSEVTLNPDPGIENVCWHWPSANGYPTILFCHGNNLNIEVRASWMQFAIGRGFGLFMAGYRGFGGNPGTPTQAGLITDALASYDHLSSLGVKDIHVLGHSLGSSVAVHLASERRCKSVGLLSPFTSMVDAAWDLYPFLPIRIILRDQWKSIDIINKIDCPIMIVACDGDTTVRYSRSKKLFAHASSPKEFLNIPGVDHGDISLQGGPKALVDFFERHR